ncbi:MAG: hypothetical protein ACOYKZ_03640 [Chlamydiia bacterium]
MQSVYGSHPSCSSSYLPRSDGRAHCNDPEVREFSAVWEDLPAFGQNISRFHLFKEMIAPMLGWAELQLMGKALFLGGEIRPSAPDERRRSGWFRCLASIFESRMQLPRESHRVGPSLHPVLRYACLVLLPKSRPGAERRTGESNEVLVRRTHRLAHLYFGCPLLRQPTCRRDSYSVHEEVWSSLRLPDQTVRQTLLRYRLEYAESNESAGGQASTQPMMNLRDEIESLWPSEPHPPHLQLSHLAESLLTMATQLCPLVPRRPAEELKGSSIPGQMLLSYLAEDFFNTHRQWRMIGVAMELSRSLLLRPDSLLACIGQHDLAWLGEGPRQVLQALILRDWFREELSQRGKDHLKIRLDTLNLVEVLAGAPHLATQQVGLPALETELLTTLLAGIMPVKRGETDLLKAWFTNSAEWRTIARGAWGTMCTTIRQHIREHPGSEPALRAILTAEVLEALLHDVPSRQGESSSLMKILAATLPDPMGGIETSPQCQALMLQEPPLARTLIEHPDHWDHFMDCFQCWEIVTLMSAGPELLDACIRDPRAWKLLEECSWSLAMPGTHGMGLDDPTLMAAILGAGGLIPMLLDGQIERPPFAGLVLAAQGNYAVRRSLAAPGILDRIAMMPHRSTDRLRRIFLANNVHVEGAVESRKYQEDVWQEIVNMPLFQVNLLHCPGMIEHWATDSSLWTWTSTIHPGARDLKAQLTMFTYPHVQAYLNHPGQRGVWYQYLSSAKRGAQLQLVQDPALFAKLVAKPDLWPVLRQMHHAQLSDLVEVLDRDLFQTKGCAID